MVIAAILLAADAIDIDGVPLALLPWRDDETLIEYEISQLQAAGVDVVVVVLGYEAERAIPLVARDGVEPIVNARWHAGGAGSIRAGATAAPRDTEAAIIVRIDEPRPSDVHRRLLEEHLRAGAAITRPAFAGAPGTPIVVGRATLAELRNATDEAGWVDASLARHAHEISVVPFESSVVLIRIENGEEYRQGRASDAFR